MTNAITAAGTVRLLGRDLSLVYDLDACDYLYDQGLDPFGDGFGTALAKRKPGLYAVFLYAGIRRDAPDVSLEQIRSLPVPEIMRAFTVALEAFGRQMAPEGGGENPPMAGDASPA
jgi:hypothetical protein